MVKDILHVIRRGLTRPIVLWLLESKPRCGYELINEFKRLTGHRLQPGIIYPFLYALEREGFIICSLVERGRRRIKYYRLTDKGRDLLEKIKCFFRRPVKEVIVDLLEPSPSPQ